jgi:hypothetical protein
MSRLEAFGDILHIQRIVKARKIDNHLITPQFFGK